MALSKGFLNFLDEWEKNEETTRGGNRPGASAQFQRNTQMQTQVRNPAADRLLRNIGLPTGYESPVNETDIAPFRRDVRALGANINRAQLPSQAKNSWQENLLAYNQLQEKGAQLEAFGNAQDMDTKMDIFRGNYALGGIGDMLDAQKELAQYNSDLDYILKNTDTYERFKQNLSAAKQTGDEQLVSDVYKMGMEREMPVDEKLLKQQEDLSAQQMSIEEQIAANEVLLDAIYAKDEWDENDRRLKEDIEKKNRELVEMQEAGVVQQQKQVEEEIAKQPKTYFEATKEHNRQKAEQYAIWAQGNWDTAGTALEGDKDAEELSQALNVNAQKQMTAQEEYDALRMKEEWTEDDRARMSQLEKEMAQSVAEEEAMYKEAESRAEEAEEANAEMDRAVYGDRSWKDILLENWELHKELDTKAAKYVGHNVLAGVTGLFDGLFGGVEFLLGKPINYIGKLISGNKDWKNWGSQFYEWSKEKAYDPVARNAERVTDSMGDSAIWDVGADIIQGVTENIPMALAAAATGGVAAAGGMATTQANAIKALGQTGMSAAEVVGQNIITNPQYWTSFLRESGGAYEEAHDAGAGEITASLYAMLSSLINSTIEIGPDGKSGIQGIGWVDEDSIFSRAVQAVAGKDVKWLSDILESGTDEGIEELKQGIVSALLAKITYAQDKKLVGGEDALFNPEEVARNMAVGFATGGVLAGGNAAVSAAVEAAGNVQQDVAEDAQSANLAGKPENKKQKTNAAFMPRTKRVTMDQVENEQRVQQGKEKAQELRVSETGMTRVEENGKQMYANIVGVEQKDGQTMVHVQTVNGESVVPADQVEYADKETAERVMVASEVGGEELANTIYNAKAPTKQAYDEYAKEFAAAYTMAKEGATQEEIRASAEAQGLHDAEIRTAVRMAEQNANVDTQEEEMNDSEDMEGAVTAYEFGKMGRSQGELESVLKDAGIEMSSAARVSYTRGETARRRAEEARIKEIRELNWGGKTKQRNGVVRSISKAEAENLGVNEITRRMSDKQKAAVKALRGVAQSMGLNIALFDSISKTGNQSRLQGQYDRATGTVYIDINAGKGNEQAMLRTAAHEITHVVQDWSPKKYGELKKYLMEYFYENDETQIQQLVAAQMEKAPTLTEAQALDEVVADACEMMLSDAEAVRNLISKDRSIFEKIREWVDKFIDAIKQATQGMEADSEEAKILQQSRTALEKVREMWMGALEDAGKNLRGTSEESVLSQNGVLEEYGEPNQVSMFGERVAPELADLVSQAQQRMDSGRVQYSLREADAPTQEDVEKLRSIGKKSINAFTDAEVQQTEAWARKFWGELKEKSPFFRRWFGDWRAYDRTEIHIVKMDDSAEIKSGKETNADSGIVMSWSKDLVNDSVRHAPKTKKDAVRIASNNIREIVRESVLLDTHVSETGKSSKLPGTAFMHSLYTLVSMDDKKVLMKLYAEQALNQKTGEIFTRAYNVHYIEKVAEFENGVHSIAGGLTLSHSTTDISVAELYEIVKQYDENFKPATVNRSMLNEDGTPKLMYHGTDAYDEITKFKRGKRGYLGPGIYLTESEQTAQYYADKSGYGGKVYRLYAKTENPLVIDTNEPVQEILRAAYGTDSVYKKRSAKQANEAFILTAADIKKLQDKGYDSILWMRRGKIEELNVFTSNQIKSETGNIGTFDASNPDIRYSLREEGYKSDRQILANLFDELAETDEQKERLARYKDRIEKIEKLDAQLQEKREAIKEIMFGGGKRDEVRLTKLKQERDKLEGKISGMDRELLQMEHSKPLRQLIYMERKKAEYFAKKKARGSLDKYREGVKRREHQGKIEREAKRLSKWLTQPNNKRLVPESLRGPLAKFLLSIDMRSYTELKKGEQTKKDREYVQTLDTLTDILRNVQQTQDGDTEAQIKELYSSYIDLPKNFVETLTQLVKRAKDAMEEGTFTLQTMSTQELEALDESVSTLSRSLTSINELLTAGSTGTVSETAKASIDYMQGMKERGPSYEFASKLGDYLNWENATPMYAFERYGEGGKKIFRSLQEGQNKLAFNVKKIMEEMTDKDYTAKEARAWAEDVKEIEMPDGKTMRIPVTHIMSLYCLAKREQAQGHIYGGGVLVNNFKIKGKTYEDNGHLMSPEMVEKITGMLTEKQRNVADKMQSIMNTLGSEWGNYVSVRRFGYKMFTEQNYFPIEVDENRKSARTDDSKGNELYRLLNMSMTKQLTPKASNRLVLKNIFDVYSKHMTDMAQYNALALPALDAVKWLNWQENDVNEDGQISTQSLRDAARYAYGNVANKYIVDLLKDINGVRAMAEGDDRFATKAVSRYNRAAVAANLRVALLQPLSIVRAGMELPGTSIAKGISKTLKVKANVKEMMQYSGIAVWKDIGGPEMNVSRSVTEQIKRAESVTDRIVDASMKGAELMDKVTWAAIWQSCKEYVNKRTALEIGSEAYFDEVARKFEDVIYRTQVVDSVLTKSKYMRAGTPMKRMLSAFMSEPTTSYNLLLNAYTKMNASMRRGASFQEAWQKSGKLVMRTAAVYTMSALLQTLVEQIMTAYRDDDDYETFMDKAFDGAVETLVDNVLPTSLVPIFSQMTDIAKTTIGNVTGSGISGFDQQNLVFAGYETLNDGIELMTKWVNGELSGYTPYGAVYKTLSGLSSVTGIPVAPAMREVVALVNNTYGYITGNRIQTYRTSKTAGYQALFGAIERGDDERAAEIRTELGSNNATDKQITSGLTTQAKYAYLDGDMTAEEATDFLMKYGKLTEDKAYFKLQEWGYENESDDDYSVYMALEEAVKTGTGVEDAAKELTEHGYTQSQVNSKVREFVKEAYLDGEMQKAQAENMLKKHGGLDANETYFKMLQYDYEDMTGESTSSDACMIYYAIDNKQSPKNAIDDALKHGKQKSGLASSITSHYKEEYLKLAKTDVRAAAALKGRLITVFDYLGYKGKEKVEGWEK